MKKAVLLLVILLGLGIYLYKTETVPTPINEPEELKPEPKEVIISFTPKEIIQGEPVLVSIENIPIEETVESIRFNGLDWPVFYYDSKPSVLIGLDLRMNPGSYPITLTLSNGKVIKDTLVVGKRVVVEAPLGIPEELGGNTPESEQILLNTLAQEGAIISAIKTSREKLWTAKFKLPIIPPIVITDTYGYSRLTGASSIAHKGTDFRASVGTEVLAINSGVVRYTGYLRNYGNLVAVDHGTGVLSIYMHLSKVLVSIGEEIKRGDLVGLSGQTGYVLGPHLHLTIRINGISIDPLKFLSLLGEN